MKSKFKRATFSISLAVLIAVGGVVCAHAQTIRPLNHSSDFAVEFSDCVESIGVTLVPTAGARAYVPNQFILAGEGQPVTPLVLRTARCNIATAGYGSVRGAIVQVGAVIVPPDGSGDINNYTIWYYTDDLRLALRLLLAGVGAQYVATLDYDFQPFHNALQVRVPLPGLPRLELSGPVFPSSQSAGSFLANWWQTKAGASVKMSTNVPVINIGGADLSLTTNPHGPLGQLIGGGSTGFPIIQQFNTFATAQMRISFAP